MKKRWFWFSMLTLLCTAALALSLVWMFRPEQAVPQQRSSTAEYQLTDLGGRVALVRTDSGRAVAVYDIYTRLLPEYDLLQLQRGIPVAGREELLRLLEDFGL